MKPTWKPWLILAAAAVAVYFIAISGRRAGYKDPSSRHPAPNFTFPDLQGRAVSLSDSKGKVVLVVFWATWCGPCVEEIPDLKALYAKYKDRGFEIIAIAEDEAGASDVAAFARAKSINYPVVLGLGQAPEGYNVPGFPASFLIDRQGRIVRRYLGPTSFEDFAWNVEAELAR